MQGTKPIGLDLMKNNLENYSDHDMLIRIDTRLEIMDTTFKEYKHDTDKDLSKLWYEKADKESVKELQSRVEGNGKRIGKIEKLIWFAAGALAILDLGIRIYFGE